MPRSTALERRPGPAGADLSHCGESEGGAPAETTLLGFAGSPWTVATYMVAGQGSREQAEARRFAYADPAAFAAIIDAIAAMTVDYLSGQIAAGAEAVQLFDSWAGSLAPDQFERWVIAPTARIVADLKARHPDVPVIGFPKGAGAKLAAYARETGVDALGLDETIDPDWAVRECCPKTSRSRAISIRSRCSPAARRLKKRWGASYLASTGGRTSSTSATASSRKRRSPMSSSCSNWCAGDR